MFTLLSANAWLLLVDGPGRDVRFFLPFFITITWSFGDFANHLLVVRVTRINFPASYRHRCYLWLISLNAALYLKNYSDGLHYEKAFCAVWAVCILAYCSHYTYCSSIGLAIRDALGVSFFSVPKAK